MEVTVTEQRVVDCDCEGYGIIPAAIGFFPCRLCRGDGQLVVTVPIDAIDEDIWEAVHELRVKRMPELFGSDDNQGRIE